MSTHFSLCIATWILLSCDTITCYFRPFRLSASPTPLTFPAPHVSWRLAVMSSSPTTTSTRPTGLAPIAGLPPAAHAILHRELLHIHSSLHLILLILRGPWDTVTPSIVDTITSARLRTTLRALETSIEQIRRSTCTTLVYTDELCSALELPHPTGRLVSSTNSFSSSTAFPRFLVSPPSPPSTTPTMTTTDPSPPQIIHTPPPPTNPGLTLTRMPRSSSRSRSRTPTRRFRF